MNYKRLILEIINKNAPLGIQKFDRLFYSIADYSVSWTEIVKELRKDELLDEEEFILTEKGIEFLKQEGY
ncbi:hypothetical protein [Olleya sp. R77988]|uniref:hypothetical protein n=1 Tax=Olleya sp. R77988 TaxID=3093875 RepID=UPI0037CADAE9